MINLVYIRAAIQAKTGKRLPLERVRELLVEEGLITHGEKNELQQTEESQMWRQ